MTQLLIPPPLALSRPAGYAQLHYNQVNGGDEWLAIKQDTPFESISFGRIMREQGREAARALLDRLRKASVERCRELEY